MRTPRRMNDHQRESCQKSTMFPHTVTLYNVEVFTDKETVRSEVINHITILRGVLLDASKAVNVRESGLVGADAVNLYIPFGVEAVDAVTGEEKKYMPPVEFWRTDEKSGFWTLAISARGSGLDGYTFFIKDVALPPDGTDPEKVPEIVEGMYDDVYNITKIDTKDFGGLQHFEVGGV